MNFMCLGNRVVAVLNGTCVRRLAPLLFGIRHVVSHADAGFKPEKVAVVTKTTRYEFEQQRYRYSERSEEDLKQLVRQWRESNHIIFAAPRDTAGWCHFCLSVWSFILEEIVTYLYRLYSCMDMSVYRSRPDSRLVALIHWSEMCSVLLDWPSGLLGLNCCRLQYEEISYTHAWTLLHNWLW